ncbi:MAG: protein-L-isoaspartate(D-aspartate) O-methyltransferase [Chloroflexota bacterium]|nr:protein-L-isoaspartate(D-aspartate) O-methyltransferase [Chloroflexota bacterium]
MDAEAMVRLIRSRGVHDTATLRAMRAVPREHFVPEAVRDYAYNDYPLSIGRGQTISQPYMVALMTARLDVSLGEKVLEIGTGSGYQTAILAELGLEVYTVEVLPELQTQARERLAVLGYENVHFWLGDGYQGWPEHAPYAGIIVTAAPRQIPPPLLEQLAESGNLIIPTGPPGRHQVLWKVMCLSGKIRKIELGAVAFVPLVHNSALD